jgi:hypothetical protein
MGEQIKRKGNEAVKRWHEKMPRFFYWLVVIAISIGCTAAAINTLIPATGGVLHEWWVDIYPYIFGGCIGVICASKLTVAGGYKELDPDKVLQGDITFKRDAEQPNMSDIETQQPDTNENG